MKYSFLATLLLIGSLAQATTCFFKSPSVHPELPATLCMNEIGMYDNGDFKWVGVYGGNMDGAYLLTEYQNRATAQLEISNIGGDVCNTQEIQRISIDLNKDYLKKIRISQLKISMEIETTRDSCHLMPQVEVVDYKLIK